MLPYQNCSNTFETQMVTSASQLPGANTPDDSHDPDNQASELVAPSELRAMVLSANRIQLSWQDNSADEVGFYIERSSDGGASYPQTQVVNVNVTTYIVSSLSPETTYHFRIRAFNGDRHSVYSNVVSATTMAEMTTPPPVSVPSAPSALAATAVSTTQINLSWTDNSHNETGFYIERATGAGSFSQIAQVGANVTSYSNTGLSSSTAYSYRIRSFNGTGISVYTATVVATTQSPPPPPPPPPPGTKMVFMASGHMGRTVMSCDGGQTWIRDRSDNDAARCWIDGPNYVECDHTASSSRGIDAGDGYFYANYGWGQNGSVRKSRDGITWTTIRTGGWGGGVAYALGSVWSLWGYNWARSTNGGQTWSQLRGPFEGMEHPLTYRAGDILFAVGRTPGIYLSRDGAATWESHPDINHQWATHFAYGNGIHLMVGGSSATRSLNEGRNWSHQANAISGSFIGLAFDGTHFVGWTSSGRWRSADGVTWSQTAITNNSSLSLLGPIAYNPETRTYVSIPNHWARYYTGQKALYSTNGVNWTELSTSAFRGGHPINHIAVGSIAENLCP